MFTKQRVIKITAMLPQKKLSGFMTELGMSRLIHLEKEQHEYLESTKFSESKKEEAAYRIFSETENYISNHHLKPDTETASSAELKNIFSQQDYTSDLNRINYIKHKSDQYERLKNEIQSAIDKEQKTIDEQKKIFNLIRDTESLGGLLLCTHIKGEIEPPEYSISEGTDEYVIQQNESFVSAIALKGHEESLRYMLDSFSFREITASPSEINTAIKCRRARLADLEKRLIRIENYYSKIKVHLEAEAVKLNRKFSIIKKIIEAKRSFSFSDRLVIFDGWIRTNDLSSLDKIFQKTCSSDYFLSTSSEIKPESTPPTVLKNNSLFKPFEMLVTNIGIPENSEYDPTPFAAITFCIMFGVMFGDIGQGLILALTGLLLKILFDRNSFLYNGGHILLACGFSAFIFGFFYGSIFSNEHILPALLFHPMDEMMHLFAMAIIMGVTFIASGMIFHIITCLSFNEKEEAFFGAKGIPGLLLYGGIIALLILSFFSKAEINSSIYTAVIAVPLSLFAMRNILSWLFFKRETLFPDGLFEYTVETLVEIIEMFSTFIGNTISFIRAGAFALSHAGLSIAVYTLAGILNPEPLSFSYILTVVIGNIFIILLEGLVCTIQSMRLEYYEIFTKFFQGEGRIFFPFSLDLNNTTGEHK